MIFMSTTELKARLFLSKPIVFCYFFTSLGIEFDSKVEFFYLKELVFCCSPPEFSRSFDLY